MLNEVAKSMKFKLTHLPLRERARMLLVQKKRSARPVTREHWQKIQKAMHISCNRAAYENAHYPGWEDLPKELTEPIEENYPVSGHGMAQLNTFLYLKKTEKEAIKEATLPDRSQKST